MLTAARTIGETGLSTLSVIKSPRDVFGDLESLICCTFFSPGSSGHAVQEQGSCFKRYRKEHSDVTHSCPELARPPWAVFRR